MPPGTDTNANDDTVSATWGDTGTTSVYTPIDLDSGAALAFTDDAEVPHTNGTSQVYTLPSTESTDAAQVDVTLDESQTDALDASAVSGVTVDDGSDYVNVTVNEGQTYRIADSTTTADAVDVGLASTSGNAEVTDPSALVVQPEDEGDAEHAFRVTPDAAGTDDLKTDNLVYTGSSLSWADMEGDSDVSAAYDMYGTYAWQDTSDQGQVKLHVPNGQAVAGAAFTGADGSLSAGASGSATSMQPTGWADHAALDSDGNVADLKQNQNLILVGGPAVNDLTSELADANKTWTGDQYSEGDAVLDHVNNAFTDGQDALVVAGYAGADTRAAANYLADYTDHQDEMSGKSTLNVGTQ